MAKTAKESAAIKKARQKLAKVFSKQDEKITKKALDKIKANMHSWLDRHKEEREKIQAVSLSDFDENKHSAAIKSEFVTSLFRHLKPHFNHTNNSES